MSNWFFHRGIPIASGQPIFRSPSPESGMETMAIYSPLPGKAPAAPAAPIQTVQRATIPGHRREWLPHCEQRIRRLTRRAKVAAAPPGRMGPQLPVV